MTRDRGFTVLKRRDSGFDLFRRSGFEVNSCYQLSDLRMALFVILFWAWVGRKLVFEYCFVKVLQCWGGENKLFEVRNSWGGGSLVWDECIFLGCTRAERNCVYGRR